MRRVLLLVVALLAAGCTLRPVEEEMPYYQSVLTGAPWTDLVVEIDHAPGYAPSVLAREHLLQELRNVTSKTRVVVRLEETLPDDDARIWNADALVALEKEMRSTVHAEPVALLHVLYPAGRYNVSGVAGVTISGTQLGPVVVFLDTIGEIALDIGVLPQPAPARDEIERATLLHEAGHAMGLVDNGLPMVRDHEASDHEGHSDNPESVMYWVVEQEGGIREALLHDGTISVHFDAADRADMRSVGGR